ncbi:TetR/AcrR family transcriptional regulator [Nocardia tengchongensis]|uniref:TetR/AcrR family transcriptional regulator n=1 Tax=Nocardia tengchongensis TaxID=2055889 RepID=UPI0036C7B6FC
MATTDSAQRSGELARTKIIEVAFEHFARHGYKGSSLARIAADAEISQSGLLHHFRTKQALLQAVLATRDLRDMAVTGTGLDELSAMDFDTLLSFFEDVVRHNVTNRPMIRLAHLAAAEADGPDHPAYEWVTGRQRFLRSLIEAALERDIAAGAVRPDIDPRAMTSLLIATMDGLESQWLLEADLDTVESFTYFTAWLRASVTPAR